MGYGNFFIKIIETFWAKFFVRSNNKTRKSRPAEPVRVRYVYYYIDLCWVHLFRPLLRRQDHNKDPLQGTHFEIKTP